jgi:hypothetical protein
MKYYTITMFSEGSLLECVTTKQKLKSMSNKTVKLFMADCGADEAQLFMHDSVSFYDLETDHPIRTIKLK